MQFNMINWLVETVSLILVTFQVYVFLEHPLPPGHLLVKILVRKAIKSPYSVYSIQVDLIEQSSVQECKSIYLCARPKP